MRRSKQRTKAAFALVRAGNCGGGLILQALFSLDVVSYDAAKLRKTAKQSKEKSITVPSIHHKPASILDPSAQTFFIPSAKLPAKRTKKRSFFRQFIAHSLDYLNT